MKGQPDRATNGSTRDLNSDDNIMQGNGEHQQRIRELQTSNMLLIIDEPKAREEVLEECRAKMRELEKMMNALCAAEKMNGPWHIKSADHNSTSKRTALQLLQGRYWTPGMDSRQAQSVPGTPAEPPGGGLVQVASFRSLSSGGGGGGGGGGEGRGGRRYRLGSDDSTSPHGADSYPPYFTKYDQEATDSPLVNNGRVSQGKVVLKSLHRRQLHELKSAGSSRPGSPAAQEERPWSTGRSPSGSRQPHGARSAGVPSLKVPVEGGGAEEGEGFFERVPSIELPLGGGGGEEVGARAVAGSGEKGSSDGRTASGGLRRRRTVDSYVDTSDNEQLVKITRIHSEKRAESFFSDTGEDEGLRRVAAEGRPHGISLLEYLKFEIIGASVQPDRGEKVEQDLANFAAVPRRLEPLLAYGTAICTDTFLYVVTFLPLRFLASLYLLVRHLLALLAGALLGRVAGWLGRPGPLLRRRRTSSAWHGGGGGGGGGGQMRRFHRSHLYDVMRFLAVLAGVLSLQNVRMSILYHYIRGQGMLKLYVITAMMETLDKLLCSIGQDALDALYRSTRRKDRAIALNFLAVIAYVVIHSVLLFVHIATLNVAVNSSEKSLMALLISNNFNEMKGSVLKKFDRKNLFQLACADIVERFKLMLFLFLIVLLNYCQGMQDAVYRVVTKVALWVLGGEVLADWVKHAFIAKFNSIPSSVYPEYAAMLSVDLTSCRQGGVILDHTYAVTRRLGFAQLPLTCVFLRLVQTAGPAFRVSFAPSKAGLALIALLTYLCLLAFKVLTGILLQAYAYTPTVEELRSPSLARHGPGRRAAGDQVRASNVEKLSIIERFTLWKGRIV